MGCMISVVEWGGDMWLARPNGQWIAGKWVPTINKPILFSNDSRSRIYLLGFVSPNSVIPYQLEAVKSYKDTLIYTRYDLMRIETCTGTASFVSRNEPYVVDKPVVLPGLKRDIGSLALRVENI